MFSIIIPTFNAGEKIKTTLQSIAGQTWLDHETIIIDNCSTDNTLDIINGFRDLTHCSIQVFSSPDKGIYDAQNKGIDKAKYPWILFLGAGDRLHHNDVLATVAKKTEMNADIIYGNILKYSERIPDFFSTQYPPERISKVRLLRSRGICQQSMIIKKNVFKSVRLSDKYQVAGDFDWILTCVEQKIVFGYIGEMITEYSIDGLSGSNLIHLHSELKSVIRNHYPRPVSFLFSIFLDVSHLKYKLKKIFHNE